MRSKYVDEDQMEDRFGRCGQTYLPFAATVFLKVFTNTPIYGISHKSGHEARYASQVLPGYGSSAASLM
jgi:hypothetical protein